MTRPIAPLRGRRAFADLRNARKVRSGALRLSYLADAGGDDRVGPGRVRLAMAVPTRVGSAVVRNRLRRRVRAHMQVHPDLTAGIYFVQLWPEAASATYDELTSWLDNAISVALPTTTGPVS